MDWLRKVNEGGKLKEIVMFDLWRYETVELNNNAFEILCREFS